MLAAGLMGRKQTTPVVPVELHYLPFDGVADYAVADAVFGGIAGDDYTVAIKVAGIFDTGGLATKPYFAAGGPSAAGNVTQQRALTILRGGALTPQFSGIVAATGAANYSFTVGSALPDAPHVLATKRTATQAKSRVVTTAVDVTDDRSAVPRLPDHIAVGLAVNDALTASTAFGSPKLVSLVIANGEVSDADLIAWFNASTAVGIIPGITHYWVASDAVADSIPARVGTVPLTLLGGLTATDLVAL